MAMLIIALGGCTRTLTKPYETSVENIFRVKAGMTLQQVISTLGCLPHQFYFDGSSGCKIVEFRYRRKYHVRNNEENVHFRDEKTLYALFYDDKLREVITSSGQEKSIPLMIDETNIRASCSYDGGHSTKEDILQRYVK